MTMREKILVVDDEPDMVELLRCNLLRHGYEVVAAQNGLEALHQARRHLPELILLDIMLDGMDGYSVCEILRRQPSTAQTPVILITALAGEIARLNGIASGAVDFLRKPVSPQDLIRRVKQVLEEQAQAQAAAHNSDSAAPTADGPR